MFFQTESNFLTFLIIFTFISVIGTVGNILTIFCYWKKRNKQTSSFFILILAFSDLIVCFLLVPLTLYMEIVSFEIKNLIFCKIYFFLITTTVPFSCLLLISIAFDRYFCICYVHISKNLLTVGKAKIIIIFLLATSCLLGIIPALNSVIQKDNFNKAQNDNQTTNITIINWTYTCLVDLSTESQFGYLVLPFKNFYDLIYLISVIMVTCLYIAVYKEIRIKNRIKAERIKKLKIDATLTGDHFPRSKFKN